ncbi:hypothetical protein Y032_0108g58 [Ancylostoma ceylanicum]|uniref:Uncharacterized protein n=1 Tax=Ancylostoma ceylanicum TaxID=53326 RepID=A0A016TFA5_9BILA|nr:hypothetical protein Y032_0108g58 [Ancylostoma ceylanicum]
MGNLFLTVLGDVSLYEQYFRNDGTDDSQEIQRRRGGLGSTHQFDKLLSLYFVLAFRYSRTFLPHYHPYYHNISIR